MDIDIKELVKAAAEGFNLKDFKGDIVGVKIVENEFGNIEDGGIGIQINNGKEAPIAKSDKTLRRLLRHCRQKRMRRMRISFRTKSNGGLSIACCYTFATTPNR